LEDLVKCGTAACGMRKVKCGMECAESYCGTVGNIWNAENDFYSEHSSALSKNQYLKVACAVQKAVFHMLSNAFYLHAINAQHEVKCGIAAVTWCDITANERKGYYQCGPH